MDDDDKKPLIFLEPLSETLVKLKEVIADSADEEGIEIFEVEDLEEMQQLIPTIGQSLVLCSNPKLCANMLKTNRKAIKVLQSKILLLSPKQIPRNTLDKFMKVGLTECIPEPVAPKTLLYKVRLFLRSISTKASTKGEFNSKLDEEKRLEEEAVQERMFKNKPEEVVEETEEPIEKKVRQEAETVDYSRPKGEAIEEEDLGGVYQGKLHKKEEEEEPEESSKKEKYQEEAIDTHYTGSVAKDIPEEEEEEEEAPIITPDETEELEKLRKRVELVVEDEIDQETKDRIEELEEKEKPKKKMKIDIEDDADKAHKNEYQEDDLGGHLKGELATGLDLEDDPEEYSEAELLEEELEEEKRKMAKLEIEEDNAPDDYKDIMEEEEVEERKKNTKLEIVEDKPEEDYHEKAEEEEESAPAAKMKLEIEDDKAAEDDEDRGKVDQIDKYMRSDNKKNKLDLEADDDIYQKEKEELEDEVDDYREKIKLEIEEDANADDAEDLYATDDDGEEKKQNAEKLILEDDKEEQEQTQEAEEEDIYEKDKVAKLEVDEEEKGRNKSKWKEDDDGGFGNRKSQFVEKEEKNLGNKADARADVIKTHYDSRESIKHDVDDDWGDKWEKGSAEEQEYEKKKANELVIKKEDLGEQTIDYSQLKKEFGEMNPDILNKKKKKDYGEEKEKYKVRTYTKTIYAADGTEEEVEFEEIVSEDEDGELSPLYEPNPVGLDIAVMVLNHYMKPKIEMTEVVEFIASELKEMFGGLTTFFFFEKESGTYQEEYSGHISLLSSKKPIHPERSGEFAGEELATKIKEFEESLKSWNEETSELREDWDFAKEEKSSEWANAKLPVWSDITFQAKEMEFIYPYFEGVDTMGYAIIHFEEGFEEDDAKTVEVILETARGIYLDKTHDKSGDDSTYEGAAKKPKEEKKGMFGGLFGKKKKAS